MSDSFPMWKILIAMWMVIVTTMLIINVEERYKLQKRIETLENRSQK